MADDRTRKQFVGDMLRSGKVPEKVELIVQDNTGQWDFSGAVLYYDSDYTASASVEYDGTSFNISNYKLNVDETVGAGQDNYILTYDHSTGLIGLEVNTGAAGGLALNDLTDVTITSATTGDILRYNGSAWVDYPDSNYAAASHTHVEADITDLGAYLENVVEDTTPQLGGDLDLNSSGITGTGYQTWTGYAVQTGDLALALTGTVSVTASTAAVTGVGTIFNTEVRAGSAIKIGTEVFTVASVASNTALTLDSNHIAGASGVTAYTDNILVDWYNGNNERVGYIKPNGTNGTNVYFSSKQGNAGLYVDSVVDTAATFCGVANDSGGWRYLELKTLGTNEATQPHYAGSSVIGFEHTNGPLYIGHYSTNHRYMKFNYDTSVKYVNVEDGSRLRIWDDTEADVATHYHDGTDYRIDLDNNTTRFRIGSSQFPIVQVDGTDYAEVCTDITTATNNYSVLTAYYSADGAQSVQLGHSGSTAAYEPGKGWLWTNTGELVYDAAIHSFKKEGAAAPVVRIYDADDSNFTTLSNDGADLDITGDGAGNINVTEIQQVQIVSNGGTYDPTYTGFYAQNGHTTGLAYMGVSNTQSGGYVEFGAAGATRAGMVTQTDAYIYFTSANNDQNVFHVVGDAGAYMDMWQSGGEKILEIADGTKLRIEDGGETDQADIYHDGTDLRVEGGSNTRLLYYDFTSSGYGGIYARNVSQVGYSVLSVESSTAGADFRYAELGSSGSAGVGGNHVDMSYLYYSSSSSTPDYPYFYFFNDYGDCMRFVDNTTYNSVDIISDTLNNPTQFRIFDSSGADSVALSHDGTDLNATFTGTTSWNVTGLTGGVILDCNFEIQGGEFLRIRDSSNLDSMQVSHNGTDVEIAFSGTGGVNFYDGVRIRAYDPTDTDRIEMFHDGTDANILCWPIPSGTTNLNMGGFSNLVVENYQFDVDQTVGAGQDNYVLTYDNASGQIRLEESQGAYTWTQDVDGGGFGLDNIDRLEIQDSTATDSATFTHDGTDFNTAFATTTSWNITGLTGGVILDTNLEIQDGEFFRIRDSSNLDSMQVSHNGTAVEVAFAGTSSVNFYDGVRIRAYDSTDSDWIEMFHDGTDANILCWPTGSPPATTNLNMAGFEALVVENYKFDVDQTVGAGQDNYVLTYDNATGFISLEAAAGGNSFSTQTVTDTDSGYTWSATGSAVAATGADTLTWVSGAGIDIDVDSTSDAIRVSSRQVTKYKTAIESVTTSTTLQDDNHFTGWSLTAGAWYKISGFLHTTQSDTAGDPKLNWTFSNAAQDEAYQYDSTNGGSDFSAGGDTILGRTVTTEVGTTLSGVFQANATTGGTLKLQWAQQTAAGITSILPGSWVTIEQIS